MVKRTTIELDEELVARAKHALRAPTIRATVEEALRRVIAEGEATHTDRAAGQRGYLHRLSTRVDAEVLQSDSMWR